MILKTQLIKVKVAARVAARVTARVTAIYTLIYTTHSHAMYFYEMANFHGINFH